MEPIDDDQAETFTDEDSIIAIAPPAGQYTPVRISILRRSNRGGPPEVVFEAHGISRLGRIVEMAGGAEDAIFKARKRASLGAAIGAGNEQIGNRANQPASSTPGRSPSPFRRDS